MWSIETCILKGQGREALERYKKREMNTLAIGYSKLDSDFDRVSDMHISKLKENIGADINSSLTLEEILKLANKVKAWKPILMEHYGVLNSDLFYSDMSYGTIKRSGDVRSGWQSNPGFEGDINNVRIQIMKKVATIKAIHTKHVMDERGCTCPRDVVYRSLLITNYFIGTYHNETRIGSVAIANPDQEKNPELLKFFNIYYSLEEKERKRNTTEEKRIREIQEHEEEKAKKSQLELKERERKFIDKLRSSM